MTVIIFGSNGMLGKYIKSYFTKLNKEVKSISRDIFDIYENIKNNTIIQKLNEFILEGDYVINCSGITNKRDDITLSEMYAVNSIFPGILDKICFQNKATFIHASTDCVFSGQKENFYTDNDICDATDHYGISKFLGDVSITEGCVIRVSIIGEDEKKSGLLEWVKSNKNNTINGFTNHYWNGITCFQWAKLVFEMIEENKVYKGIKHVSSKDSVSKYELVNIINEVYSLNINITPIENNYCNRALSSSITINKTIKEQIIEMKLYST